MSATVQTQINLVHLQSGIPVPSVTQRTSVGEQFAANAISVGTADETIPLGDVTTPKQVMVKLISGDLLRIGLDGTTYPFELVNVDEATLFRLAVESIVETSTVTCGPDTASSLSGKYFDLTDRTGVARVWFNMAATSAFGSITYGAPVDTDTVVVSGTTFTKVAAAPAANEFTNIGELNTLVTALSGITSTHDGSIISIVADTAGTAGNSITLALGGGNTGTLTMSGATLTGGSAASSTPTNPGRLAPVVIAEGAIASVVAEAIVTAFSSDTEFSASAVTNLVTFTDKHTGTRTNISAGDSGFTVSTTQQGAASPVIHLKSTVTSQVVVAVAPH